MFRKEYRIVRDDYDDNKRDYVKTVVDRARTKNGAWKRVDQLHKELDPNDKMTWYEVFYPDETLETKANDVQLRI